VSLRAREAIVSKIGLGIGRDFKNMFYKLYVFNINLMLKKIMYKNIFKIPTNTWT
jgi:hypothetical protein